MTRHLLTILLPAVWILTFAGPLAGQTAPDEPIETGKEEILEVRLVQIAILARDRQGRPVEDLTAEEMTVKDRGDKLRVAFLDPFVDTTLDQEPVPEVRLYIGAPGGWEGVQVSTDTQPQYVVFFVDVENDQKLKRDEALDDMIRFTQEQLGPAYRAAVLSYNGEINLEVTFTQDQQAVIAGLHRAFGRSPRPDTDLRDRVRNLLTEMEECDVGDGTAYSFHKDADMECLRGIALQYADERRPGAKDYLSALESLIRFVSGLKGRKTVLAMSHGTAVDPVTEVVEAMKAIYGNTEQLATMRLDMVGEGARIEMDELMNLALSQQVTLHFIDRNSAPSGDFGASNNYGFMPNARPMLAAFVAPQMDLEEMAVHTGGVFIPSPDSLYRGLKRAMDLEKGGYTLGYYVEEYLSPKRLRKVSIDTSRRGVRIFHRRGYYESQSRAPKLSGGITTGAPVPIEEDGREGFFYPIRLSVSPLELGYQVQGDSASATVALHVQVEWWNGRVLTDSYHFMNHAYPRELWEAKDIEPITINGWVELPPGKYRLVATLTNVVTGFGGEVFTEVDVPEAPRGPTAVSAAPPSN